MCDEVGVKAEHEVIVEVEIKDDKVEVEEAVVEIDDDEDGDVI